MSAAPRRVRVDTWTWFRPDGTTTATAALTNGRAKLVIHPGQLREIADALHDTADHLEATA